MKWLGIILHEVKICLALLCRFKSYIRNKYFVKVQNILEINSLKEI